MEKGVSKPESKTPHARVMVRLEHGPAVFNMRAVALVHSGDRLLLQRCTSDGSWTLPGGRVELGETATQALEREMMEELGEHITVTGLAIVAENFFTLGGKKFHELDLHFHAQPSPTSNLAARREPFAALDNPDIVFEWVSREQLQRIALPILPREALLEPPADHGIRHLVIHQEDV